MINKVKKEKTTTAAKADTLLKEMMEVLCVIKKHTRLTDKDKTRFTCEMTEEAFDVLSDIVKRIEKKEEEKK